MKEDSPLVPLSYGRLQTIVEREKHRQMFFWMRCITGLRLGTEPQVSTIAIAASGTPYNSEILYSDKAVFIQIDTECNKCYLTHTYPSWRFVGSSVGLLVVHTSLLRYA